MRPGPALLLALGLVGSISLSYGAGTATSDVRNVEAAMGASTPGSLVTGNGTEASASAAGSLLSLRTDVLYLNNTNATGIWYAKIVAVGSNVSNIVSLTVGIDNGTASTAQVLGALGAITQTSGSYVRLEPASVNVIYLTQAVSVLGPDSTLTLDVYTSDATTDEAYVITNANLTVT